MRDHVFCDPHLCSIHLLLCFLFCSTVLVSKDVNVKSAVGCRGTSSYGLFEQGGMNCAVYNKDYEIHKINSIGWSGAGSFQSVPRVHIGTEPSPKLAVPGWVWINEPNCNDIINETFHHAILGSYHSRG